MILRQVGKRVSESGSEDDGVDSCQVLVDHQYDREILL